MMTSIFMLSVFAQYTLEANYDYAGNDILSPTATDADACQKLCDDDLNCVGFIIIENDPNVPCWTKKALVGRVFKIGWMTYHKSNVDANEDNMNATETITLPFLLPINHLQPQKIFAVKRQTLMLHALPWLFLLLSFVF